MAVWHSHPHGDAAPSQGDIAGARAVGWEGRPYLITGRDGTLRGWLIVAGVAAEIPVV